MTTSPESSAPPSDDNLFLFGQHRQLQVLSVSGGGYRGLFAARLLERYEQYLAAQGTYVTRGGSTDAGPNGLLARHFRFFVGTSAGALIAAAAALGRPMAEVAKTFAEYGPSIFPKKRRKREQSLFQWPLRSPIRTQAISDGLRAGRSPPYKPEKLQAAIKAVLGQDSSVRLSDIPKPLAIVAMSLNHAKPIVFRSAGLDPYNPDRVELVDALLASAAAPSYFPPHRIGEEKYIDGGVVANTPDVIGVIEAIGRLHGHPLDTYMLSVGTASMSRGSGASRGGLHDYTAVNWIIKEKLVEKIIAGQEDLAQSLASSLLIDRYYRIDLEPTAEFVDEVREIDYADDVARSSLISLADEAWRLNVDGLQVRGFLG